MAEAENGSGYGKQSVWRWVAVYVVVGLVVYGIIYYLVAKKGMYGINSQPTPIFNQQASSAGSVQAAKNSVQISNYSFSPATLTVKAGESVTWTNQDSAGHSATANDKSFDTGILEQDKSGTIKFDKAGTYSYYCSVHPNMHGTIVVQ